MNETLSPGSGPALNFGFHLFEFVSDFDIRILNLPLRV